MKVVLTVSGGVLLTLALRDIFHTLFHPKGRGSLNRLVSRGAAAVVERAARRAPGALELRGPSVVVAVIATWAGLVALGWTLVYWPWLPDSYSFSPGLRGPDQDGFLDAMYLSLVTMTTLGYGDVVPTDPWLRIAAPLQALVGFALLSAAISWVLALYPALARRRSFLDRSRTLEEALGQSGPPALQAASPSLLRDELDEIAGALTAMRTDLIQLPATSYFGSAEEHWALARRLRWLEETAGAAASHRSPDLEIAGRRLLDVVRQTYAMTPPGLLGGPGSGAGRTAMATSTGRAGGP